MRQLNIGGKTHITHYINTKWFIYDTWEEMFPKSGDYLCFSLYYLLPYMQNFTFVFKNIHVWMWMWNYPLLCLGYLQVVKMGTINADEYFLCIGREVELKENHKSDNSTKVWGCNSIAHKNLKQSIADRDSVMRMTCIGEGWNNNETRDKTKGIPLETYF